MRINLLCIFIIATFNLIAADIPQAPTNCFSSKATYCSRNKLIDTPAGAGIKIELFATIDAKKYGGLQKVLDRFYAFQNWKDYIRDFSQVEVEESIELEPVWENGIEMTRQYAHIYIESPWPINKTKVRDVSHWYESTQPKDKIRIINFKTVIKNYEIPGEPTLYGADGVKYKTGRIMFRENANSLYDLYVEMDVRPDINFARSIAATYMESAIVALFRGIFRI